MHGPTCTFWANLAPFSLQPLPAVFLGRLGAGFATLRSRGLKSKLRFAYQRESTQKTGPVFATVFKHLQQLRHVVRNNSDAIYALDAGFIGAWGEWHSSVHGLDGNGTGLAMLLQRELSDLLPSSRMVLLRTPGFKDAALRQALPTAAGAPGWGWGVVTAATQHSGSLYAARLGYSDDCFMCNDTTDGGTWYPCASTADIVTYRGATDVCGAPGNPFFDYMTAESPYLVIDGEMQWHSGRFDANDRFSGLAAAERLRLHHYSSLSLRHGFAPLSNPTENASAAPGNINRWMNTTLDVRQVAELRLPISPDYTAGGPHSEFDYLRDHLGYRLELQSLAVAAGAEPAVGALKITGAIVNRGMAAPQNPRDLRIVLLRRPPAPSDGGGGKGYAAAEIVQSDVVQPVDIRRWHPFEPGDPRFTALVHTFTHTLSCCANGSAELDGSMELGLWLADPAPRLTADHRYSIRLANAGVWWDTSAGGVNVLGNLSMLAGARVWA
jgi:hypothetical protein